MVTASSYRGSSKRVPSPTIVPYLADRAYHLPGNTWIQDWVQYFTNNHPVLGICCHDRRHPVGTGRRILILIGSIACGLAISNLIYLYFHNAAGAAAEQEFVSFSLNANVTFSQTNLTVTEISFTNYQVALWTLGTSIHALFDLSVWYFSACACCQPGGSLECLRGFMWIGNYVVYFTIVVITAVASLIVVLRATLNDNPTANSLTDYGKTSSPDAYRFLIAYCIELLLALFCYYFILGTILFSGVLGCGVLPFLGGRPREVWLEERQQIKQSRTHDEEWADEQNTAVRKSSKR
jgi:hypothetical protein